MRGIHSMHPVCPATAYDNKTRKGAGCSQQLNTEPSLTLSLLIAFFAFFDYFMLSNDALEVGLIPHADGLVFATSRYISPYKPIVGYIVHSHFPQLVFPSW